VFLFGIKGENVEIRLGALASVAALQRLLITQASPSDPPGGHSRFEVLA